MYSLRTDQRIQKNHKCIWARISPASIILKQTARWLTIWGPMAPSPSNILGCVQFIKMIMPEARAHKCVHTYLVAGRAMKDIFWQNNMREKLGQMKEGMMDYSKYVEMETGCFIGNASAQTPFWKRGFKGNWQIEFAPPRWRISRTRYSLTKDK